MDVGHLARYADVVGVEIGEVLFAVFGIVKDLRQRFVAVLVGVDIGVVAFVGVLLQQAAAVQTKWVRFGLVLVQASLSWRSLERRRPNGS